MPDSTHHFYNQMRAHLEAFQHPETLPKVSVTLTGIPRRGLTVKYQNPSSGSMNPAEMAGEAAKITGAAGVGTVGGAAVGAIIGKALIGGSLARIGVASAGAAIGIPIFAPVAIAGGLMGMVAYAAFKLGKGKREQQRAETLLNRLMDHMRAFSPTVEWPEIEMFVLVSTTGLAATWQPEQEG